MPHLFRRSIGLGTIFLSAVGLVLCIAAIVGAWMAKSRLMVIDHAAFAAADEALALVDVKLDGVKQLLEKCRQRVTGISRLAERLKNADADVRQENESLLQTLDDLFVELKSAESWLDSGQAVAQSVGKMSESLIASDYADSHEQSTAVEIARQVREFSESVTEIIAKVLIIRQEILQLRKNGKMARDVAAKLIVGVTDLDGRLAKISTRIDDLGVKITHARASCVQLGRKVKGWIVAAAVVLTLLFLWFGVSQGCMTWHGWKLVRGKPELPRS